MARSLLIVGSGGQGKVALDCALEMGCYDRIVFMTSDLDRPAYIGGYKVVGEGTFDPRSASSSFDDVFVAVGDNVQRQRLVGLYGEAGAHIPVLRHPTAVVSRTARVGEGTILMPHSSVNAFARVGAGCIVNTGAVVEHDCAVGCFCHLSPGARLGGCVTLGDRVWVCLGASVCDHVSVCSDVVIGANSFVRDGATLPGTYVGAPARLARPRAATAEPGAIVEEDLIGKRLLVLAGAEVHRKVVLAAKELGVYTIVTDYLAPEDSPAKLVADEHWEIDIMDVDAVVARCRERGVEGVLAFAIDPAQIPYQRVCAALGLPCYGTEEQFRLMTSKVPFKERCGKLGLLAVPDYSLEDVAAGRAEFPVVVKPALSRGSRGQVSCSAPDEVPAAYEAACDYSSDGLAVIERDMHGAREVSLSYVVIDGVPYLQKLGDRYMGTVADGLQRAHVCTLAPSLIAERIVEKTDPRVRRFVDELGLTDGLLFFQGFADDGGEVYLFDPGLRLPGSDFDVVLKDVTGFDAMKTMVRFALTGKARAYGEPRDAYLLNGGLCVILSICVGPGTIGSIEGLDRLADDPRVHSVARRLGVGDVVSSTGDIAQRAAECVAYLAGRDVLPDFLDFVYSNVRIEDEEGHDMIVSRMHAENGDPSSVGVY